MGTVGTVGIVVTVGIVGTVGHFTLEDIVIIVNLSFKVRKTSFTLKWATN